MKKYRKKPALVEAVKLTEQNIEGVLYWLKKYKIKARKGDGYLLLKTPEGTLRAEVNKHYVVKGYSNSLGYHFWPVECGYFEENYEEVEENQTDIINLAKEFLEKRAQYGEKEYGQRLHPFIKGRFSLQDAVEEAADLFVYLLQFNEEMKSVTEILHDAVAQACWIEKEQIYDSMSLGAYADALRFLEAAGKVKITKELNPDWVIAKVKDEQ